MKETRLNKYLSEMGMCSRREADRLIEAGKVLVDGKPAALGDKVLSGQRVVCNGKPVGREREDGKVRKPKQVVLLVNKPRGVVCTTTDNDRAENIVEMVHYPERVYPVGRLDKDSEGLILMTNRGELVNELMRSSANHEKEYVVILHEPVTAEFVKSMAAGVYLKELKVTTKPCLVERTGKREFHITLTQGLNRQIRRMCEALGCHVQALTRIRILNLRLGRLKPGTYRRMTIAEEQELMELLKGQEEDNPEGEKLAEWVR